MRRRSFIALIAACAVLDGRKAAGQRRSKLPRAAIVFIAPASDIGGTDVYAHAFADALRELGLVDGHNVIIERRSAERQPELAAVMEALVALGVDVIVTGGPGVRAARGATDRVPIVALVDDALDSGLIASLARPGGNVTGFGGNFPGLYGKDLQILKEAVPTISRVAVIATKAARDAGRWAGRRELDAAGSSIKLDMRWLAVDAPVEFESAFATMVREGADAVFVTNMAVNFAHLRRIADLAMMHRLPSFCEAREFAEVGGLLSYGYGIVDDYRHAAAYVKKILDGAKPADLPWGLPTKLELVINLKTAKALGLTIPQTLLLRADEVIQ